jgi:hypothetical protein
LYLLVSSCCNNKQKSQTQLGPNQPAAASSILSSSSLWLVGRLVLPTSVYVCHNRAHYIKPVQMRPVTNMAANDPVLTPMPLNKTTGDGLYMDRSDARAHELLRARARADIWVWHGFVIARLTLSSPMGEALVGKAR